MIPSTWCISTVNYTSKLGGACRVGLLAVRRASLWGGCSGWRSGGCASPVPKWRRTPLGRNMQLKYEELNHKVCSSYFCIKHFYLSKNEETPHDPARPTAAQRGGGNAALVLLHTGLVYLLVTGLQDEGAQLGRLQHLRPPCTSGQGPLPRLGYFDSCNNVL